MVWFLLARAIASPPPAADALRALHAAVPDDVASMRGQSCGDGTWRLEASRLPDESVRCTVRAAGTSCGLPDPETDLCGTKRSAMSIFGDEPSPPRPLLPVDPTGLEALAATDLTVWRVGPVLFVTENSGKGQWVVDGQGHLGARPWGRIPVGAHDLSGLGVPAVGLVAEISEWGHGNNGSGTTTFELQVLVWADGDWSVRHTQTIGEAWFARAIALGKHDSELTVACPAVRDEVLELRTSAVESTGDPRTWRPYAQLCAEGGPRKGKPTRIERSALGL